jgi:hypothetical protein
MWRTPEILLNVLFTVIVLNDNPAFKAGCIFVSSSPHLECDQEAEVASFLDSLARASDDSVAYLARSLLKKKDKTNIS